MQRGDAPRGGAVELHRGPRATEAALLAAVVPLAAEARAAKGDPARLRALLAAPIRVVVPSRSLREHVAARLARALGGAGVGLVVQTLRGLAYDVLLRARAPVRGGDSLFPILVRRQAAREPALRRALHELHDGYGVVAGSVGDLLDAGLEAHHVEALLEWLGSRAPGALGERAQALVRVAAATLTELGALGLEHRSGLFRRAETLLAEAPALLPSRALLVHGYADATGVQADLLERLRSLGARILVDQPESPVAPGELDAGAAFTDRLLARLGGPPRAGGHAPEASIALFRAPGAQAEVREVAERIARHVHEEGAAPESIGVVARDLAEYGAAVRTHFARLGVPFSGGPGRAAVEGPEAWPARALEVLLREREGTHCDRWLDAGDWLSPLRSRDLRLALHALGVGRLKDVASLEPSAILGDRDHYLLPVRRGLAPAGGAEEAEREETGPAAGDLRGCGAPRRGLARGVLEDAVGRARRLVESLRAWPELDRLDRHLERLRGLTDELGWKAGTAGRAEWLAELRRVEEEVGPERELERGELALLVERATRLVGAEPLGGAGAGVAVLEVTEARGRSFEHLYVLGLNRDRFPRAIVDDPLLPDALRIGLLELLPDLPVKRRGFDEERYLFAQLCAASPRVTLSWQEVSDDGKERAPSPLVVRLLLARGAADPPLVPPVLSPRRSGPAPAHELAVRAGLAGAASAHRGLLAAAWGETRHALGLGSEAPEPTALAAARAAVLGELDPSGPGRRALGPYFGFLGSLPLEDDPPAVTRLEALARCPWQAFLERVLRLEPLPDARVELPSLDARAIGNALHRVLERIVAEAGAPIGGALEPDAPTFTVPWPAPPALEAFIEEAASAVLREEGVALRGMARVLAARVRPLLEAIRRADWPGGVREGVLGGELRGAAELAGASGGVRLVAFRADRADREKDALLITDYKSGKPPEGASEAARRAARGELLQAAAYARARAPGGAVGRYLYAKAGGAPAVAALADASDPALGAAFERAAGALLDLAGARVFFPRLIDAGRVPRRCREWCQVSEACRQHDTDARHRLGDWAEEARRAPARALSPAERAARDVWWLGRDEA